MGSGAPSTAARAAVTAAFASSLDRLLVGLGEQAVLHQVGPEEADGVAPPPLGDLVGAAVLPVVVVGGVGVVAIGAGIQEGGPPACPGPLHRLCDLGVHGENVVAVDGGGGQAVGPGPVGQIAAHLVTGRYRDRVPVVLDEEDDRQAVEPGEVEGLVEVALRGGALTPGDQHHAGPARASQLVGDAGGVGVLGAGDRRAAEHPAAGQRPVVGHLPAPAAGITLLGEEAEEDLLGRQAQGEHQGEVAVVGEHPVDLAVEGERRAQLDGLLPGGGDDEGHPALTVESPTAVVELAGEHHQPMDLEQRSVAQPERPVVFPAYPDLWAPRPLSPRSPAAPRSGREGGGEGRD